MPELPSGTADLGDSPLPAGKTQSIGIAAPSSNVRVRCRKRDPPGQSDQEADWLQPQTGVIRSVLTAIDSPADAIIG